MAAGEIARLFVTIGAKTEDFDKAITGLQGKLKGFNSKLSDFGTKGTKYVTLPIVAMAGAMVGAAVRAGDYADELLNLSATTGIHTDQLQRWRWMEIAAGAETDSLAGAVASMNKQMMDGTVFGRKLEQTALDYGVALRDSNGYARDGADIISDLIFMIAAIEDPMEKARVGQQAFGGEWENIAAVVNLSSDAIDEFNNKEVVSQQKLEEAAELTRIIAEMKKEISETSTALAVEFVPIVADVAGLIKDSVIPKVRELTEKFTALSDEQQLNILKWIGIVAVISPAVKILSGIGTMLGWLPGLWTAVSTAAATAATALGVSVGVMLWWIGLIAAAIWGAVEAWQALKRLEAGGPIMPGLKGGSIGVDWDKNLNRGGLNTWGLHGFDTGGIVPGPIGKPTLALVHGGETILPTHKMDGGGGTITNNFNIERMNVRDDEDVERIARELYELQNRRTRGVN